MASPLAHVIADIPGLARVLVREHARTPEGRCAVCTAGPQAGRVLHPCSVFAAARAAQVEIARRRSRPHSPAGRPHRAEGPAPEPG